MRRAATHRAVAALLGGLVVASGGAADAREVAYAIVVANSQPPADRPDLRPLRYADDDAARYLALFERFAASARLFAVLDGPTQRRHPRLAARAALPSLDALLAEVERLRGRMLADRARGDEPVLYLAWSGHGALDADGEAYLPLDSGGRLTGAVLRERVLGRLPAGTVHLVIDACHAGGLVGARGDGDAAGERTGRTSALTGADVADLLPTDGLGSFPQVGVLLASASGQASHEWSEIEAGVFSHEVLSALHGLADVNGDGAIEYSEVAAFAAAANRDVADARAVPRIIARPPARDRHAVLVRLDALTGTSVWRGDAARLGRFHVELADGTRFVDGHRSGEAPTALALPRAGVAWLRGAPGEARLEGPPPRGDAFAGLRFADARASVRGAADQALRRDLFAAAYGPTYYRGFVDQSGEPGVEFAAAGDAVAEAGPASAATVRPRADRGGPGRHHLLLAGAGVGAAVAIVGTVVLFDARADYAATDLERPAAAARDRYHRGVGLAVGGAAAAIGLGSWSAAIWPSPAVAPLAAAGGGQVSVGVAGRW